MCSKLTPFASFSVVHFEQVNITWEMTIHEQTIEGDIYFFKANNRNNRIK